uniref:Uncharacterized protein n=1 Tax=Plectus sambesii TaxID=2011161 RepID=A0A914VFE6_9BILA
MSAQRNIAPLNRQQRQHRTLAQKEILIKFTLVKGKAIREAAQVASVNRPCGGSHRQKLTPDILERIEEDIE